MSICFNFFELIIEFPNYFIHFISHYPVPDKFKFKNTSSFNSYTIREIYLIYVSKFILSN